MSSDSKRAEFEIALEYDPAAAKKAKEDIEELKKYFHDLGKQTAKLGQVRIQQPRTGVPGRAGITPAEHELKALAKVTRADQKRREDYESWWGKQIKAQDDAAKREARRVEREATQHVKDNNALKAGEGMIAERLNKQHERSRKAAEREIAKAKRKEETNAEKQKSLALKQQHATEQTMLKWEHHEQRKADQERRRRANQELAQANQQRRKAEKEAEQHYKKLERDKERALAKETRELAKQQRQRDRMRSQGFREGASMARTGAMRMGAGAIAAGTLGVQAHLAMSKGVGEIMTLDPALSEAEAKAMIKGGMSTYGGETTTTAKAIYDIASSGFGNDKEKLQEVFDAASKLAVGGVTDVATAADGLTSALNAWKDKGYTATNVTDQFFQAAKEGKITIEQLSSNLGTFAAMAQSSGVSLEESMAVLAEVTKQGVQPGSAASGLRQMIKSITNPTKEAETAAKRMGLKVGASAIRDAGGLEGWFVKMLTSERFTENRMQDIFSDVDGKVIVDALRSLGPDGLSRAIAKQQFATGATDSAVSKMMATDHMRAQKIMGEVRVALVEFGEAIMPLVRDAMPHVTAGLQDLRKWLEKEENRNLLISATKVALMLGGVAAVGGPLANFIKVLNLLSAGALASSTAKLVTGMAGAAGAANPLGLALMALTGVVLTAKGRIDDADAVRTEEEEKRRTIRGVGTSDERNALTNNGEFEDERAEALRHIQDADKAYFDAKNNTSWFEAALDGLNRVTLGGGHSPLDELQKTRDAAQSKHRTLREMQEMIERDVAPYEAQFKPGMTLLNKAKHAYRRRVERALANGSPLPELPSYFPKDERSWADSIYSGGQSLHPDDIPYASYILEKKTRKQIQEEGKTAENRWENFEKLEQSSLPRGYDYVLPPPPPLPSASQIEHSTVDVSVTVNQDQLNKVIDVRIDRRERESARAYKGPMLIGPT